MIISVTEMMTFLVTGDFVLNAELLDSQRLAKQRVEAKQILDAIASGRGWIHHPIVKAWSLYPDALKYYANCVIREFMKRGGHNTMAVYDVPKVILMPWWATWTRLHQSHRAMLLRKNPFYYTPKFSVEPEYMQCGYIWPHALEFKDAHKPLSDITAAIPQELQNPVFCTAILKSGTRAGQPCQRLVKDKMPACSIHRT